MLSRQEILDKMKKSRTWRETGLTVAEVYGAFSGDAEAVAEHKIEQPDQSETIAELQKTIDNLRDSVKRLRAENKKLKAER